MLKYTVRSASWKNKANMMYRSSVITRLVSDPIAFIFYISLQFKNKIGSSDGNIFSISHEVNGTTSLTSTKLKVIFPVTVLCR